MAFIAPPYPPPPPNDALDVCVPFNQLTRQIQLLLAVDSVEQTCGLGGDERASTVPSQNMTANLIGILEDSLGQGVWTDVVGSQLARPLDAVLAYLPPEGARVRLFFYGVGMSRGRGG